MALENLTNATNMHELIIALDTTTEGVLITVIAISIAAVTSAAFIAGNPRMGPSPAFLLSAIIMYLFALLFGHFTLYAILVICIALAVITAITGRG